MADSPSLQPRSLGKIAVPTPGTPVRVTSDTTIRAHRIRFAVVIGETGRVFLGVEGMNKATGAGVVKEFWPTGAGGGVADELVLESAAGDLRPSDYFVDGEHSARLRRSRGDLFLGGIARQELGHRGARELEATGGAALADTVRV